MPTVYTVILVFLTACVMQLSFTFSLTSFMTMERNKETEGYCTRSDHGVEVTMLAQCQLFLSRNHKEKNA